MCYDITYFTKKIQKYEERFGASYGGSEVIPMFHASGFTHPEIPVITNAAPEEIQLYSWGLIPFWVKDLQGAAKIRNRTLNARDNTLFEKPSFRAAARKRRCLVLVDGFFDHHWHKGKSYPFFIRMANGDPFAFGGIYEHWKHEDEVRTTVSIVTTDPNKMMEYIHNKPAKSETARMPFIVPQELEDAWLDTDLPTEDIQQLILPFPDDKMESYTVPRLRGKAYPGNIPAMQERVVYDELTTEQGNLF
jgi:putative SOS response-associated peptidase YedK